MNNIKYIIVLLLFSTLCLAQVPEAFSYQGIANDTNGSVIKNGQLGLRFTILESTLNGPDVYQESQQVITTGIGHFSAQVGRGDIIQGMFVDIDWGMDNHFLKVELDINGGNDYAYLTTVQLSSVPYAFYTKRSGNNPVGLKGADGPKGETGPQGPQGPQGSQGPIGARPPIAADGPQGDPGPAGLQGPQGLQGLQGETGDTGADGQIGASGAQGAQGAQGQMGEEGPQGAAGIKGTQGSIGPDGPPSNIVGPKGDTGPQGANGGPQGPQGEQGPQGGVGGRGIQGDEGPRGMPFYWNTVVTNTPPINPIDGDVYIDDGTNRTSGKPGFRRFDGSNWMDI